MYWFLFCLFLFSPAVWKSIRKGDINDRGGFYYSTENEFSQLNEKGNNILCDNVALDF